MYKKLLCHQYLIDYIHFCKTINKYDAIILHGLFSFLQAMNITIHQYFYQSLSIWEGEQVFHLDVHKVAQMNFFTVGILKNLLKELIKKQNIFS